jgi:hypothetical protein
MFIGYVEHSTAYRFRVLKSDVLDSNTIIETKNIEFFEHIFPLSDKNSHALENRVIEDSSEGLRRSKKSRKKIIFWNDFYTCVIENDPLIFSETISSSDTCLWK